jgi:hypothetical protein
MAAEPQTFQPGAGPRSAFPWWDVRRPGTLHLYVGLFWAWTPVAIIYLHQLSGQHFGAWLIVVGTVWVAGHIALVSCVLSLRLIQRTAGRVLFFAAVVLATAGVAGAALLTVTLDTLPMSDFNLFKVVAALPQLVVSALALLSLSARRSSPRSSTPTT